MIGGEGSVERGKNEMVASKGLLHNGHGMLKLNIVVLISNKKE